MDTSLRERIKNCTAHRKSREEYQRYILANPSEFPGLVAFGFEVSDKDSHKACWILEFVAYKRLDWFVPQLDFICENLSRLDDESSIRPLAKICQLLVGAHFTVGSKITLSESQLQKITEASFDWLIGDFKVASKAYSMRTLFILGKHSNWILPELKDVLEKGFHEHTAAYKAAAREILKKLAKIP